MITTVWAASFALTAVALALIAHAGNAHTLASAVQVAGFVVPMSFTVRYASAVRARTPGNLS